MCQQCVDAVKRYWPDLPDDRYGDLLICATALPFGDADQVVKQVQEKAEQSRCNLGFAMSLADRENDFAVVNNWRWIWPLQYAEMSDSDFVDP